jgi:hypothetical protein
MGRGDPGFFGSVFKTIGGAALGFLTGGPLGAIKGAVAGSIHATASNIGSATLAAGDDPAGDAARLAAIKRQHAATLAAHPGGARLPAAHRALLGMGSGRHRRIRWTNTKALGRAERRIHAAVKHMSKYIRWVHPKKEGHAAPHFGKHKKRAAA